MTGQEWGRADEDGTVYVRTEDGERKVGQYPGVTQDEALGYFVRKFDDLAAQVKLLEQRMKAGQVSPADAESTIKRLEPTITDANAVGEALMGVTMRGNTQGEQTVGLQKEEGKAGVLRRHLLTTGLEYLYEGHTIATIQKNESLSPLIYGSANNLVAGFFDKNGKRAIFDGGFTRLYMKWDTAGTARYVKNAAAWLVNVERFAEAKK